MSTAMTAIYPATALGVRLFVTDHTVTADSHGRQSVELQWMQRAGAGAFVDVLAAAIVGSAALILADADVRPAMPLIALVALAVTDAVVRYLVIHHRAG
ncbi:MAG: hypothetical protein JWN20_111 [Jatrophihabitantaceae bacterium]|nr:hypothetical protein [Jatrophihabitantaceae bacterium]